MTQARREAETLGIDGVTFRLGDARTADLCAGTVYFLFSPFRGQMLQTALNRLRREGLTRTEAIILGGKHRLRPILLTAVTTILGLSPMVAPFFLPEVFGQPEGRASMWAPVGLVILGGLTTSTFLTLLVTPTIYSLVDDFTEFGKRILRTASGGRRSMAA